MRMVERIMDKGLATTYALVVCLLVIFFVVMYSLLTPFRPIELSDVHIVSEMVCPSELVKADANLAIEKGNYVLNVDPAWTNVDDGRTWDIAEADFPVDGPIKTKSGSDTLVYSAPSEPGEWLFVVDVKITGRQGILPREYTFDTITSETVTNVVDCGGAYTYEEYARENGKAD